MSGGDRNRKKTPSQGWEEAGAEFYQESYPSNETEFDVVVFQRDPKHLATLLPSKQNRVAATTMTKTFRRTSGRGPPNAATIRSKRAQPAVVGTVAARGSFNRRTSAAGEVHVAMLPDLSENLSNEQTTWEEIMLIKALPVTMAQKREMKSKLRSEPNLRLQGFEQLKWKRRKIWDKLTGHIREAYSRLELWRGDFKHIEGNCGTGVVAYFLFIKWLLLLNLTIFAVVFAFVVLPSILLADDNSVYAAVDNVCQNETIDDDDDEKNAFVDFVQGTGFVEKTLLFYGTYSNKTFEYDVNGTTLYYDLPLAYLCTTIVYFLISLIAIVRAAARGFRERLIEGEGQFYQYCNLVFGGWDFCIHNGKSAETKRRELFNEIRSLIETERRHDESKNRTQRERSKLIVVRIFVNTIVLAVLAGCGAAIYVVFDYSNRSLRDFPHQHVPFLKSFSHVEKSLYEFLPAITIVLMNIIVPWMFGYLVQVEKLSPINVVRVSLMRTVFLRLSSLLVLYASLYSKVACTGTDCLDSDCSCWETYVGQQVYRLFLVDFALRLALTFLVNFPRALLARHSTSRLARFVGAQKFEIPKHALDTIYSQTLCWLGAFYAPLLPAAATLACFLTFYIKKFACLVNASTPSITIHRASRSNSAFMIVLLVSYATAILPIVFAFGELSPSRSCGPFRSLPTIWSYATEAFATLPEWLRAIVFFISTAGFAVPSFVVVSLALYYYRSLNSANRHMVAVLKNQLVLEGHDKQFLLDRLSMFIKQQQESVASVNKQRKRENAPTGSAGSNTKESEGSRGTTVTSSN